MSYFAQLNDDNIVINVIRIADEHEANGEQWCHDTFGGRWKQTSYTASIRGNYAGIGMIYLEDKDIFMPPKPFPSWIISSEYKWIAPIEKPSDGKLYRWSEKLQSWITIETLFANYGLTQDESLIQTAVDHYQLENHVMKEVYKDEDFSLSLLKANHIIICGIQIRTRSAAVAQRFREECDKIHRIVNTDIYAHDQFGNIEYEDITKSPAWTIGHLYEFEFVENAVLGDGLEHFILKRPLSAVAPL